MRVITLNVNGLRSAVRKGFFPWLESQQADVVCLQETRIQDEHLADEALKPAGFCCFHHHAAKKGYSGVAVYTREQPDEVTVGLGMPDVDEEGRYLEVRLGDVRIASLYMHSGSSGEHRQARKFDFMARFMPVLRQWSAAGQPRILCGDWNIAHKPIDLKNWKSNQTNSGFLPEEREWMDQLLGDAGYVDAFRIVNQQAEQYTWWSNRGQAWAKNVGWRIDYQIVTLDLAPCVLQASIYKDQRFSDHAPLVLDYDLSEKQKSRKTGKQEIGSESGSQESKKPGKVRTAGRS